MKKLIISVFALIVFSPVVSADIILFKTGTAKIGVIEEETPTTVKLRIKDAVIGISRSNIEKIEYATPEENEDLELKWEEEKERIEAERRQRREELEKFEKEQEDKGLIKVDGEWLKPRELEGRKEGRIRETIKKEQAALKAEESVEESEETELPEYIENLPEDQKEQYLPFIEKQKNIEISQIRTQPQSNRLTRLTALVMNTDSSAARKIYLEIVCYDENDEEIFFEPKRLDNLGPGQSTSLRTLLRIENELISRTTVRVVDVDWK